MHTPQELHIYRSEDGTYLLLAATPEAAAQAAQGVGRQFVPMHTIDLTSNVAGIAGVHATVAEVRAIIERDGFYLATHPTITVRHSTMDGP